jgi:DNA polymerase-3 subunit gamma/tau
VATVLGLVGRDLPLDTIQAVADEDAAQAFAQAGRAVEMGYDLRAVCRELSRAVRDLLVLSVDPARISDPEIAAESERDRLTALVKRFSREDLLRAFDVLAKAEAEIRGAAQPRYTLEMALLKWMYLRKLVSIEELILGSQGSQGPASSKPSALAAPKPRSGEGGPKPHSGADGSQASPAAPAGQAADKDALLAAVRSAKPAFYNAIVAQAQRVEVLGERIVFTFAPGQRAQRDMFERERGWVESVAQQTCGRRMAVAAVLGEAPAAAADAPAAQDKKAALKQQALADPGVQTMLEVFAAEIRDV